MAMDEAAREAKRAYERKWRRENPDKVRKYKENYWNKKAEKLKKEREESEGK